MRSETEMMELLLEFAGKDERIRAVYMNGSRTNSNAPEDIFRDYDIVYAVANSIEPFVEDEEFPERFGQVLYKQLPDEFPAASISKDDPAKSKKKRESYGWLVQYADGNRVDFHVVTTEYAKAHLTDDLLVRVLLDKDGALPEVGEPTDEQYWVKRPSFREFSCCLNEFWWCSNNIAKGLWREEMPYVQDMTNFIVRKQVEKLLHWKVGILTDFSVSVGKSGKYLKRFLPKEDYDAYLSTYFGSDIEGAWNAIFVLCALEKKTADFVGNALGYPVNTEEAEAAEEYLHHVRGLRKDAEGVY